MPFFRGTPEAPARTPAEHFRMFGRKIRPNEGRCYHRCVYPALHVMEIVRDLLVNAEQPLVRHYSPGELRIGQTAYEHSLVITPHEGARRWEPQDYESLQIEHIESFLEQNPRPELILLGTGEKQRFLPREYMAPLINARIGIEVMTSAAASRTWNIVLSEGRQALAAILIR